MSDEVKELLISMISSPNTKDRKRKIIFWYDPKEEYLEYVNDLVFDDNTELIIYKDNSFKIRYHIEVEELNKDKLPVHCYNFSYNRHANEEEIPEDTELEWTACSIPETVLEVYRKIFRKKEA